MGCGKDKISKGDQLFGVKYNLISGGEPSPVYTENYTMKHTKCYNATLPQYKRYKRKQCYGKTSYKTKHSEKINK